MIFNSLPRECQRLVRVEDSHHRNPITLDWDQLGDCELKSVTDAAGFTYTYGYTDFASGRRLTSVTLPGGRVMELDYEPTGLGRLTEYRDPVVVEQAATGMTFEYGPATNDQHDIVKRTLPDGEVIEYTYHPSGKHAGKVASTRIVKSSGTSFRHFQYDYDDLSASGRHFLSVTPLADGSPSETMPTIRYEYTADGRLKRQAATAVTNYTPWKSIVEDLSYDHAERLSTRKVYPVDDAGQSPPGVFAKVCYGRDADGNLTDIHGPVCVENATGTVLDEWGEGADCEDPSQTCPGPQVDWEAVPMPSILGHSAINADYYRVTRVTPASELSGAGRAWTLHYHAEDVNPFTVGDGSLKSACPPTYDGPLPPGPGDACEHFEYDYVGSTLRVRLRRRIDAEGALWDYAYHPNGMLQSLTEPDIDPGPGELRRVTTLAYDTAGLLDTVTAPNGGSGLVTSYDWTPRGQVEKITHPKDQGSAGTTGYTYSLGGKLRRVADLKRGAAWWFGYDAYTGALERIRRGGAGTFVPGEVLGLGSDPDEQVSTTWELRAYNKVGQLEAVARSIEALPVPWIRTFYDGHGNVMERGYQLIGAESQQCHEVDALTGNTTVGFTFPWGASWAGEDCDGVANAEAMEIFVHDLAGNQTVEALAWNVGVSPKGHRVTRSFDQFGRLAQVDSELASLAPPDLIDPDPSSWTPDLPLSQQRTFTFDAAQRLVTQDVLHGGALGAQFTYEYLWPCQLPSA